MNKDFNLADHDYQQMILDTISDPEAKDVMCQIISETTNWTKNELMNLLTLKNLNNLFQKYNNGTKEPPNKLNDVSNNLVDDAANIFRDTANDKLKNKIQRIYNNNTMF